MLRTLKGQRLFLGLPSWWYLKVLNPVFAFSNRDSHSDSCELVEKSRLPPLVWSDLRQGSEEIVTGRQVEK
jgi:hypothetical protein